MKTNKRKVQRKPVVDACWSCKFTFRPCGRCARHAYEEAQAIWHRLAVAKGPEAVELRNRLELLFAPIPSLPGDSAVTHSAELRAV